MNSVIHTKVDASLAVKVCSLIHAKVNFLFHAKVNYFFHAKVNSLFHAKGQLKVSNFQAFSKKLADKLNSIQLYLLHMDSILVDKIQGVHHTTNFKP